MDKSITVEELLKILNAIYDKSCEGIPKVSKPIDKMAQDYISKNRSPQMAAKNMISNQIKKCAASGFITGFGGLITLPVTVPANISSVLYEQMRMIACCAYLGGYDITDDQVQTFIYACLAGVSVNSFAKKFGIQFGEKVAVNSIKKIPGKVLTKINQKLGFRFITKFGEHGLINLGKLVPGVGAAINGGLDLAETRAIANRAYKMFIEHDFSVGEDISSEIIDVDYEIE